MTIKPLIEKIDIYEDDVPGYSDRIVVPTPSASSDLLGEVISSFGSAQFYDVTLKSLCRYTARQCGEVMLFDDDGPPEILARYPHSPGGSCEAYLDHLYVDDPVYQVYRSGRNFGIYSLGDLAPALDQTEYFDNFYAGASLFDEIGLLLPLSDGRALSIWVGQHDAARQGMSRDYRVLDDLAPTIGSLVQRQVSISRRDAITAPLLDLAISKFGSSLLSAREQEVTRLLLRGYPANLVGDRLDISEGTVCNHRKAIFRKLEIRSRSELFALFMQSVAYWKGHGDPMDTYMSGVPVMPER